LPVSSYYVTKRGRLPTAVLSRAAPSDKQHEHRFNAKRRSNDGGKLRTSYTDVTRTRFSSLTGRANCADSKGKRLSADVRVKGFPPAESPQWSL